MSDSTTPNRLTRSPVALQRLSLGFALAWMTLIFYLSSHPMPEVDLGFTGQDKVFHLGAYAVLGVFCLGALRRQTDGYSQRQALLAAAIAAFYGACDEWHQSFVPGRSADSLDLLADATGALLGASFARLLLRPRR